MEQQSNFSEELFSGLRSLAETAFPKHCASCGRKFETAEQFIKETESINPSQTGLRESLDDDDELIIEAFRNCPCGSTLMEFFDNRRDLSEKGEKRRKKFDEMLQFLMSKNIDRETARTEMIKVVRGGRSEMLSKIQPPKNYKDTTTGRYCNYYIF